MSLACAQLFKECGRDTPRPSPWFPGGVGLTLVPRNRHSRSNVDQRKGLSQHSTRHARGGHGASAEGLGTGSSSSVEGTNGPIEKGSPRMPKGLSRRKMPGSAAVPSTGVAVVTLVAVSLGLQNILLAEAQEEMELPYVVPAVTTASNERAISLARQLRAAGVEMYGAFWCNHCYDQKQIFGMEAMADFPYVECYPEGYRKGIAVAPKCDAANLKGFPTWVFGEKRIEGEQPLRVLENALRELKTRQ